jgi:hypothetical protein
VLPEPDVVLPVDVLPDVLPDELLPSGLPLLDEGWLDDDVEGVSLELGLE